jgi:hypothetical protein
MSWHRTAPLASCSGRGDNAAIGMSLPPRPSPQYRFAGLWLTLALLSALLVVLAWAQEGVLLALAPGVASIGFGVATGVTGRGWHRVFAVTAILVGVAPIVVLVLAIFFVLPDLE